MNLLKSNLPRLKTTVKNPTIPFHIRGTKLIEYVWRQVRVNNSNFICFTSGLSGTGKSLAEVSKAYMLDVKIKNGYAKPNWNFKKLVFSANDFIKAVSKNGKYSAIIWDDAGQSKGGANARTFYTEGNQMISNLFQVMRFNKQFVSLTLPVASFFDAQARKLAHARQVVSGHNTEYSWGYMKFSDLDAETGNTYSKFMRFNSPEGRFVIRQYRLPLPPEEIVKEYNEISESQKDEWINYYADKLDAMTLINEDLNKSAMQIREENTKKVLDEIETFRYITKQGVWKLDYTLMKDKLHISLDLAKSIARELRTKMNKKGGEAIDSF